MVWELSRAHTPRQAISPKQLAGARTSALGAWLRSKHLSFQPPRPFTCSTYSQDSLLSRERVQGSPSKSDSKLANTKQRVNLCEAKKKNLTVPPSPCSQTMKSSQTPAPAPFLGARAQGGWGPGPLIHAGVICNRRELEVTEERGKAGAKGRGLLLPANSVTATELTSWRELGNWAKETYNCFQILDMF